MNFFTFIRLRGDLSRIKETGHSLSSSLQESIDSYYNEGLLSRQDYDKFNDTIFNLFWFNDDKLLKLADGFLLLSKKGGLKIKKWPDEMRKAAAKIGEEIERLGKYAKENKINWKEINQGRHSEYEQTYLYKAAQRGYNKYGERTGMTNEEYKQLREKTVGEFTMSGIENRLEEIYVPVFQKMMGLPPSQAKATFQDILKSIKNDSENEGTSRLPANYGDIRLQKEATDDEIRSILRKIRREGATDEDIRWYWNVHDLERRMMLEIDNISRMALFTKRTQEGDSPEEASKKVRKAFPMFGDPDDTTHTRGQDRPLPHELKDRINRYVEKRSRKDLEQFKRDIANSSTFNALIRREIQAGNC